MSEKGLRVVSLDDCLSLQAPPQTAIIFTKDTERALRQLIREEIANALGMRQPPSVGQTVDLGIKPEVDLWAEIVRVGCSQG